jgi:hypothetical protein
MPDDLAILLEVPDLEMLHSCTDHECALLIESHTMHMFRKLINCLLGSGIAVPHEQSSVIP